MKSVLKRDLLKQLIPVSLVATVAAVLLVTPSFAAKRQSAWVAVNATSGVAGTTLVAGNNLVFSGCGYAASSSVSVVVKSPFAMSFTGAATDTSGCFSTANSWEYTALMAGSYTVDVYQSSDHHNPSGSLAFDVS
jgi:hypothetical protein